MFNVSALLLDDALKPVTPLTIIDAINENQLIFDKIKVYKNYTKFLGHPGVIAYLQDVTVTLDNNWDNKHVDSCC